MNTILSLMIIGIILLSSIPVKAYVPITIEIVENGKSVEIPMTGKTTVSFDVKITKKDDFTGNVYINTQRGNRGVINMPWRLVDNQFVDVTGITGPTPKPYDKGNIIRNGRTDPWTFEISYDAEAGEYNKLFCIYYMYEEYKRIYDGIELTSCIKANLYLTSPIMVSIPQQNLKILGIEIPEPEKGENTGKFVIVTTSNADMDVNLENVEITWLKVPPKAKKPPEEIKNSNPYVDQPILKSGDSFSDDELIFTIYPKAIEGQYIMDIKTIYSYINPGTRQKVTKRVKIDPVLELKKPAATIPPEHPPISDDDARCDTGSCHSLIKGYSSDLFNLIILGVCLIVISILILNKKN